jgi:hypothetical protein
MKKIPFAILATEIDKLYPPIYQLKPNETLDEHMKFIENFILACGWSQESFLEEYIHRSVGFPPPQEMN